MKAVVYKKYGPPEVLKLVEVKKPQPKKNEVLVKVHTTTVTAADWRTRKADPFIVRLFGGLFRPNRIPILGFELAGTVESVGEAVDSIIPGDRVFGSTGFGFGAYAEYKCLSIKKVAKIPDGVSYDEAAPLPIGAITGIALLKKRKHIGSEKVLIYGASGSVGTYAIQLANYYGAKVTAVCSLANLEFVKSVGADKALDYTNGDFRGEAESFDLIFDAVGKTSQAYCKTLLNPGGTYVTVNRGISKENLTDLDFLVNLVKDEKLKPIIDRIYPLEEVVEAHRYVESFRKKGNVILQVGKP